VCANYSKVFFTVVPCVLILSKFFIYQLMHKRIALKRMLKFTLRHLLHVSVQSPSPGSALFKLAEVTVVKIMN
jgi:hypothetical protein